ncbi:MAG: glycosyl hydrolase, partial [Opitutales bacterium]
IIPGLGRTGDAVGVFPTTAPSLELAQAGDAPALEYPFYVVHPGNVTLHYNLIPTQPIQFGHGLRFAFSIDDGPPQLVTITAGTGKEVTNPAWSRNVLNNSTSAAVPQTIAAPGLHTLKIYGLDPGVLLEKIVIDAGGLRPSYLGPPETFVPGNK